jgi:hypothetical protein
MAWETLKAAVEAVIKTNGTGEITGQVLQDIININLIPQLGKDRYKGIATAATAPGTPQNEEYYLAYTAGTYANFGGLVVSNGVTMLIWKAGVWEKVEMFTAAKIENWTAKDYLSGEQVNYLGRDWVSSVAVVAADIPGISNKWTERLSAYGVPIYGFPKEEALCSVSTGVAVDWNTPTANTGWNFITESCMEGDVFDIKGYTINGTYPVYAFLGSDDKPILIESLANVEIKVLVSAPLGAVRIVHNSLSDHENYVIKSSNSIRKLFETDKEYNLYLAGEVLIAGYIPAVLGGVVDWENPLMDSGWGCASLPCVAEDSFDIRGYSFSGGVPVYAFLNSSNIAIKVSSEVAVLNNAVIVAPVNAVRVVFTSQTGYSAYLKKTTTAVGKLSAIKASVVELDTSLSTYIEEMDAIVETDGLDTLKNNQSLDTTDWGWLTVNSAYIGYNEIAENDALLKTARILRFNSAYASLDTLDAEFVIGTIDQRKNLIPSRTYQLTGVRDGVLAGINPFEYIKFTFTADMYIKKGEVCFIKVNSISPTTTPETIAINAATYDAAKKLLYTRELVESLTEVIGKGAMEFVIEMLPYNSIFSTKAELVETKNSITNLAQTVNNNTIFNDSATGLNYKIKVFNGDLILKNLNVGKLLVIGNSMVKDAFVTLTGDDRAMVATVPDHGFADFIASKFSAVLDKISVFEFEHDYAVTSTVYDFATNWNIDNDYDAIIFSIGANTPTTDSTSLSNLTVNYGLALEYLKTTCPQAEIYVHTPFQSGVVSNAVQAAALAEYLQFIDTSYMAEFNNNSDIFKVGDYYKDAAGVYQFIDDLGIARHPSDIGHLRIADTLLGAMASTPHTAIRKTITLNQSAGGVIETPNASWVQNGVVTIRVFADSGKSISSLSVIDIDAGVISATQRTNTHGIYYTFLMPAKDVVINPVFV